MKKLLAFFFLTFFFNFSIFAKNKITIFAAASLTDSLRELEEVFEKQTATDALIVLAASSTLARQIQRGASADIFISANKLWMDRLEHSQLLANHTRFLLLKNKLVLITQKNNDISVSWNNYYRLEKLLVNNWVAIGNPAHVPVGMYAKIALSNLGFWEKLSSKIVRTSNVRSALAYVLNGETLLGVVYHSDLVGRRGLKLVAEFPKESYPEIEYPIAILKGRQSNASVNFLAFLKSKEAQKIFKKKGFLPIQYEEHKEKNH